MFSHIHFRGHALRIAVGIMTLVLLMAGGAQALFDRNISSHTDIKNSFVMHRMDAGITSNRDSGMPLRNAIGELTSNEGLFINDMQQAGIASLLAHGMSYRRPAR